MNLDEVEAAIGFRFKDRGLLSRALTHGSYRGESGAPRVPESDNEQLEFLGDAVLGLLVSEHVVRECPDFDEGRLSNVKHRLVNRQHLAEVGRKLQLGRHLMLGRSEDLGGGREKTSLLANAFEALLGAVYLDGGIDPVRSIVREHVVGGADLRSFGNVLFSNDKARLESLTRERGLPMPEYVVKTENSGYPQRFLAEVRIGSRAIARASETSKKKAELAAARELLRQLEESPSLTGT